MSVDGGGTKLIALLFDDQLRLLGEGRSGAINPVFDSMASITATMGSCIAACMQAIQGPGGIVIDRLHIAMPGPSDLFRQLLEEHEQVAAVVELCHWSEGKMCMMAGIQREEGLLALAGTGSGVFAISSNHESNVGGWGSLFGDEGSGYDIGRQALLAAIRYAEDRGEPTILKERIEGHFDVKALRDVIDKVYNAPSTRSAIAAIAKLAAHAAHAGDELAIRLFANAGGEMAEQLLACRKRHTFLNEPRVTLGGSVWKGHPAMFETFKQRIWKDWPEAQCCKPLFDPVVGGIIWEAIRMERSASALSTTPGTGEGAKTARSASSVELDGLLSEEMTEYLKEQYAAYLSEAN